MLKLAGAALAAAVLACSGVKAAEMHVSHFGQVMPSVPWIIALEQGLFVKNGVDITDVISAAGGGSTLRNLLAGGVPFGEVATAATVNGIQAGLPVKIVGIGVRNAADNDWVVLADSPLKSFRDIAGKKVGATSPGSLTTTFCELLLKHNGLDTKQVTLVPLGVGAAVAALNSGAVDTSYMYEPLQSKFGDKYRPIAKASDVLPKVAPLVLVASQEFIDKQPDKLRAILRTHKQAVDFIYANPQEAARLSLKRMVNVDEPAMRRAVERMVQAKYFSPGTIDADVLEGTRKLLEATGDIKPGYDLSKVIDARFVPN
jgi:NitT/TauT family transport system substrate-binding protein